MLSADSATSAWTSVPSRRVSWPSTWSSLPSLSIVPNTSSMSTSYVRWSPSVVVVISRLPAVRASSRRRPRGITAIGCAPPNVKRPPTSGSAPLPVSVIGSSSAIIATPLACDTTSGTSTVSSLPASRPSMKTPHDTGVSPLSAIAPCTTSSPATSCSSCTLILTSLKPRLPFASLISPLGASTTVSLPTGRMRMSCSSSAASKLGCDSEPLIARCSSPPPDRSSNVVSSSAASLPRSSWPSAVSVTPLSVAAPWSASSPAGVANRVTHGARPVGALASRQASSIIVGVMWIDAAARCVGSCGTSVSASGVRRPSCER